MARSNDRDHPEYGYGVEDYLNARAQKEQEEVVAAAWGLFEARASRAVQDQLKAVPGLRSVLESGIHLGISAALEYVMAQERRQLPKHKAIIRDLHEAVTDVRSAHRRAVPVRIIEAILVRYR